jgi:YidC/Oxa1 family membrane protein insertase
LPVLASIYRLVVLPTIAGHPHVVLAAHLFGAPLAAHWPEVLAAGGLIGPGAVGLAVGLLILVGLAVVLSRDVARRAGGTAADSASAGGVGGVLRLLPFGTVVVAVLAPVAVGLYLLAGTAWTVCERRFLPRLVPA